MALHYHHLDNQIPPKIKATRTWPSGKDRVCKLPLRYFADGEWKWWLGHGAEPGEPRCTTNFDSTKKNPFSNQDRPYHSWVWKEEPPLTYEHKTTDEQRRRLQRRAIRPTLVSWCPYSETYLVPYEPGPCIQCDEPRHRTHKRLMYICPVEDRQAFFDRSQFLAHNCQQGSEETTDE